MNLEVMPPQQRLFIIVSGLLLIGLIVELVRRRRLREEFSWLWILLGVCGIVFALWYDLQLALLRVTGAKVSTSVVFVFAIFALALLNLHAATKISKLTREVKLLAQEIALLRSEERS